MNLVHEILDVLRFPERHTPVADGTDEMRSAQTKAEQLRRELEEEAALVAEAERRLKSRGWLGP